MKYDFQFRTRCERIYRLVEDRPGITGNELKVATKSLKDFERKDAVRFLLAEGRIRKAVTPTGGRPKTTYSPVTEMASSVTQPEAHSTSGGENASGMSIEQIEAINKQRRKENQYAAAIGLRPVPLLPLPDDL